MKLPLRSTVDIQLHLEGKPDKVLINGVDYLKTEYLLIEFDANTSVVVNGKVSELAAKLLEQEKG
jgi:hypothetical protein